MWDESRVREASALRKEARDRGMTRHFGRIVELCFEKGSELAPDDPNRKIKGRSVFLGNNVRDQDFNWAEYSEATSNPPTMEAAKVLDALGCLPGYSVM